MVSVLDSSYEGKAIGTFTCNKEEELWGRYYKADGLTMRWFIDNKIKDAPTVLVRDNHLNDLNIVVDLDSPVWYDSEVSYSGSSEFTTMVTFKCEFNNADVEKWKNSDVAQSYVGECYQTLDGVIYHIDSISEYQVDYPNYRFNVTEVDRKRNTINKKLAVFDIFELVKRDIYIVSKEEFNLAVKGVCSALLID